MSDVNGTVVGIQGRAVDSATPNNGDVLTWDSGNSEWTPVAPPQPLQPWVGSVDTQRQVIQRIPFTCRTTGPGWTSTGVQYTLPTDSGIVMFANFVNRAVVAKGTSCQAWQLTVANNGGTLTTPNQTGLAGSSVSGSSPGNPDVQLTTSGTTVTLEVAMPTAGAGVNVDWQGYVDLMVI